MKIPQTVYTGALIVGGIGVFIGGAWGVYAIEQAVNPPSAGIETVITTPTPSDPAIPGMAPSAEATASSPSPTAETTAPTAPAPTPVVPKPAPAPVKQTTPPAPPAPPVVTGHPKGTPLPMKEETDPNNRLYGQMVVTVDPATYCAAHSGSTINGVPQCD